MNGLHHAEDSDAGVTHDYTLEIVINLVTVATNTIVIIRYYNSAKVFYVNLNFSFRHTVKIRLT